MTARRAISARTAGATTVPYSSIARSISLCGMAPTLSCNIMRWWPKMLC
jgi:hypothetical protein